MKQSLQYAALWRRTSIDRRASAPVALHGAPPEITGRTSISSDVVQAGLARDQLARADHEHGVGAHAELVEDRAHRPAPHDLDLPVGVTQPHLHGQG